jgi:hypothetical protein
LSQDFTLPSLDNNSLSLDNNPPSLDNSSLSQDFTLPSLDNSSLSLDNNLPSLDSNPLSQDFTRSGYEDGIPAAALGVHKRIRSIEGNTRINADTLGRSFLKTEKYGIIRTREGTWVRENPFR